ncbi:unnamed protein product [Eruca vesicaria subsp. sativa]|uniref:Uncharacterized protein n=1 Tax=Eruca vesicaria subsp. sativa TaxID=29727 RepID=A0ABC8KC54_ERUVS|nr:unnamed protein product [Eruca vesicaria subsp. sativa]
MDPILQAPADGFKFDNSSGYCCEPRNSLDSGTSRFTCFYESKNSSPTESTESQNPSLTESTNCSEYHFFLKYINDMLVEEDFEGQSCMLENSLALLAAEASFFEVLQEGQTPPSMTSLLQPTSDFTALPDISEESTRATAYEMMRKKMFLKVEGNQSSLQFQRFSGYAESPDAMRSSSSCFDHKRAAEKLEDIRAHSYSHGDATQRLGYHFAEALEAHITGIMKTPLSATFSETSMFDILTAYKEHPGGPPTLRVTGIELPQLGFRPSERLEETGRRLKRFCDKFNVPFEYNFIAKN